MVIDADLAEFVDDDRHAAAMLGRKDAVEQRRLPGSQKAGQDGHRHSAVTHFHWAPNTKGNSGIEGSQYNGLAVEKR
jgi:hypothetical protein